MGDSDYRVVYASSGLSALSLAIFNFAILPRGFSISFQQNVEVTNVPQRPNDSDVFLFGPFRLIASERLLLKGTTPVALGGRALDILMALVEQAGEVVGHEDLVKRVWSDVIVESTSLRVHIAGLRKAIGDGRDGARYIINVPAKGYCFVAPVQRSRQGPPLATSSVRRISAKTLPERLERMVGRDETVEGLRTEVISRRFVSLVGPGGVGKTTVAIAAAHALEVEFRGSVCFVDLSTIRDAALLITAIASAVGCLEHTQESQQRLLAFLSDKRILLVLDSCEHVLEPVALLTECLFQEAPLAHIIATTREALRVEGENIHQLSPLGTPASNSMLTAASALASPAVQLFVDRAAAGGLRRELSDEDASVIAYICRQLDGMPLAIELAASQVSVYGIDGLAKVIGHHLMLVWRSRRSVPRHQTLQAMLDWSYDLLSDREKAVLSALSVFVGAFTLEMAQAVVPELDRDELHIAEVIASLLDKSLVSVLPVESASSYRLLDTTRSYAAVKARERGEDNAVSRRHALYYAERLGGFRTTVLRGRDLTSYRRQIGDIRAALEWGFSTSGDSSVGLALSAGAVPLFLALSMLSECRRWSVQALHALTDEDRGTKLELELQLSLAISSNHAYSDSAEVGNVLERGLSLADSFGDAEYQLELLAGLNLHLARVADFGGSLAAAERFAAIARVSGGAREVVTAEWMLGASYHLVGNQRLAQESYENGFKGAATAGVKEVHSFGFDHQVRALIGCARTLWLRGLPDQAAQLAYQGIEVAGKQEHPISLCICLLHSAPVFLWRGDLQIVEELVERLIACAAKYSLPNYEAGGVGLRGQLMLARGQAQLGVEMLRAALATLQTERRYMLSSTVHRALAEGLAIVGNPTEATIIIDGLVAAAIRGSGTFELPDLLRTRALVLLAAPPNNWSAAEESLNNSLACARQQYALGWELRSALALARLWLDRGLVDQARSLLVGVHERFTEGLETADLIEAERQLRALGVPIRE
ncbi:MAG: transcriptional regulator [Edaphobacter sp.]|nr:transcriptional regulator [Edaphobacter sp.]